MRIGVDARAAVYYDATGIGTYVRQLAAHLAGTAPDDEFLYCLGDTWLAPPPGTAPILPNHGKDRGFWRSLRRPLSLPPDLDLFHSPQNGIGAPADPTLRLLVTAHDLVPCRLPETCSDDYLSLFRSEGAQALKRADLVLAVSHCTRADLIGLLGLDPARVVVVYEAPPPLARPSEEAVQNALARFGLRPGYYLSVGGYSKRKNLPLLLQAVAALRDLPGLTLVVLGRPGGGTYEECREIVATHNLASMVHFLDLVALGDLAALYTAARALVYPSRWEGFGLPPLEAMSLGTPVIASSCSCLPEILGQAAYYVDLGEPETLARALRRFMTEPELAAEYARRGPLQAAGYTWAGAAQATVGAYRRAAGEKV
ncbi:MAG: glycosyltransferase family 4 protein [Bacteroidota bacterium]